MAHYIKIFGLLTIIGTASAVAYGFTLGQHSLTTIALMVGSLIFQTFTGTVIILLGRQIEAHTNHTTEMVNSLETYKLALNCASNHIVITDPEGKILFANPAAENLTGYAFKDMQGQTPRLWGRQMPPEFYKTFWHQIKDLRLTFHGELTNKRKNGELYSAMATVSPIVNQNQQLLGFVGVEEDITNKKNIEMSEKAHLDELARLNKAMVDRELKMIELKKQLKQS